MFAGSLNKSNKNQYSLIAHHVPGTFLSFPWQLYKIHVPIIPIPRAGNEGKKVQSLVPGHTARMWHRAGLNPGSLAPEALFFTTIHTALLKAERSKKYSFIYPVLWSDWVRHSSCTNNSSTWPFLMCFSTQNAFSFKHWILFFSLKTIPPQFKQYPI